MRRPFAAALTLAAVAALAGPVSTAAAKSVTPIPAQCSGSTSGFVYYSRQGSRYTIGMGVNGTTANPWHVTVTDEVTVSIIDYTSTPGLSNWAVTRTNVQVLDGHRIDYRMVDGVTGETCTYAAIAGRA